MVFRRDVSESSNPSYAFTDGNSKLDESERATKKVHEYEAIWLSGSEPSAGPPAAPSASGGPVQANYTVILS